MGRIITALERLVEGPLLRLPHVRTVRPTFDGIRMSDDLSEMLRTDSAEVFEQTARARQIRTYASSGYVPTSTRDDYRGAPRSRISTPTG